MFTKLKEVKDSISVTEVQNFVDNAAASLLQREIENVMNGAGNIEQRQAIARMSAKNILSQILGNANVSDTCLPIGSGDCHKQSRSL